MGKPKRRAQESKLTKINFIPQKILIHIPSISDKKRAGISPHLNRAIKNSNTRLEIENSVWKTTEKLIY